MDDAPQAGTDDRRERRIDVASASLLAIATVLAAWSAFQSAKWSGEQATAYAQALFKGDPDAWETVKQSIKSMAAGYRERIKELAGKS